MGHNEWVEREKDRKKRSVDAVEQAYEMAKRIEPSGTQDVWATLALAIVKERLSYDLDDRLQEIKSAIEFGG